MVMQAESKENEAKASFLAYKTGDIDEFGAEMAAFFISSVV